MWDCKTSQMSQSPLAALNASGLFATEDFRESKATHVQGAPASVPTSFATSLQGDREHRCAAEPGGGLELPDVFARFAEVYVA